MTKKFETNDVRFRIAAARRILYRQGCDSAIAGHVSARAADGEDAFWVTPFGYFDETVPTDVVKVGYDLEVREGKAKMSPAVEFHAAIYQERADVESIIHTHSHYVSVFTTASRLVGMYNVASVIFHDEQAIFEEDGIAPSAEGKRMVVALGEKHVLLMRHHGALIVAKSLEDATIEALTLEKAARFHLEGEASGGEEMALAEVINSRPGYDEYYRKEMWKANFRRIQQSDPDLFEYAK